jgi:hypothetical protein
VSESTSEQIELVATIPARAGAIKIDGGQGEGGAVALDVGGDYLLPLMALTAVRGRQLDIVIRPRALPAPTPAIDEDQTVLAFPAQGADRESIGEQLERAEARGFVEDASTSHSAPSHEAEKQEVDDPPTAPVTHEHAYDVDGICTVCGEPRWTDDGPPIAPATDEDQRLSAGPGNTAPVARERSRRVHRGFVGKRTRRRAKR